VQELEAERNMLGQVDHELIRRLDVLLKSIPTNYSPIIQLNLYDVTSNHKYSLVSNFRLHRDLAAGKTSLKLRTQTYTHNYMKNDVLNELIANNLAESPWDKSSPNVDYRIAKLRPTGDKLRIMKEDYLLFGTTLPQKHVDKSAVLKRNEDGEFNVYERFIKR